MFPNASAIGRSGGFPVDMASHRLKSSAAYGFIPFDCHRLGFAVSYQCKATLPFAVSPRLWRDNCSFRASNLIGVTPRPTETAIKLSGNAIAEIERPNQCVPHIADRFKLAGRPNGLRFRPNHIADDIDAVAAQIHHRTAALISAQPPVCPICQSGRKAGAGKTDIADCAIEGYAA